MTEKLSGTKASDSMWRWWPCFIGGFCGPLLAHVLVEWMPSAVAVGVAFFIMWVIVGLVFTVSPPSTRWSLARWTAGGALGALMAGTLALVVHA
jgi:hypothetical protein